MNVAWRYDPPVPVVSEVIDMPDGERSIVVHSLCESLRRMWAEIERLTALIDGHGGPEPEHNDGTRRCKECNGPLDPDGQHQSEWADCSRSQVRLNDDSVPNG